MEIYVSNILQSLIFPPGGIWLLLLISLLCWFRYPYFSKRVLIAALVLGYVFSTPFASGIMLRQLQWYPALALDDIDKNSAGAIVVLSAGRYKNAPEYGGDTLGSETMVRLRYGAYLHRRTGLPILVSGGRAMSERGDSLAKVMADSLNNDFRITNVWQEDQSRTTAENALFSQQVLKTKGVDKVYLVTHAYHMPRSVSIFESTGLTVIPAPTAFAIEDDEDFALQFLPNAKAMDDSYITLHEFVGKLWYALRHPA